VTGQTRVMVNGEALTSSAGLQIRHALRSDLRYGGVADLADIPLLARAFSTLCP